MTARKIASAVALAFLFSASIAAAQTTNTSASSTVMTPNTGAGGDAVQNVLVLGSSAVIALAGGAYLLARRSARQ